MASTLIRTTVKKRLVALIADAMPDVSVTYAWPGKSAPDETVFLANTEGTVEITAMRGPGARRPREDRFDVVVVLMVTKIGQNAEDVEERLEELMAAVDDALASVAVGPLLGSPTIDGLLYATVTDVRGPESGPNADGDGHRAVGEITINVRTRLT